MKKSDWSPAIARTLKLEGQAILDCAERMLQNKTSAQVEKALGYFQSALDRGGKIVLTGIGKSGKVAQKIAATLCSTGSFAVYLHSTEGLHGDLGLVRPQDAVLALSYTGNTEDVLQLLPSIRNLGVPVVGMGGNASSRLASLCDAWIDGWVESEACPHNLTPTSSTTLALALGDAIAMALMQLRNFDAQSFAKNHPGGSLGRRLQLRVRDLMHAADHVPTVGPQAMMDEVVSESTLRKLGAVLVVEGKQLLGIITDGDIRRSLKAREKFFHYKAEDIMTRKPVTARPEMMAQGALQLMEDRSSQISVLPVTNDQGEWVGLIRLHDLVRAF